MRNLLLILANAAQGWRRHGAKRLGAALAFYSTLAMAPLGLVAVTIAGRFFGEDASRGEVIAQFEHLMGREQAVTLEGLLHNAAVGNGSYWATAVSAGIMLVASMGVFGALKDSLDNIWEVHRTPGVSFLALVKHKAIAFALVISTGFLLMVSLLLTTWLTFAARWVTSWLPLPWGLAQGVDVSVSFVVITLLFALIFRALPDVRVPRSSAWLGACVTSILFLVGKSLISLYIGSAGVGSIYGAAGSLVVLLVWTYYSAQIFFFGAELVRAHAELRGQKKASDVRTKS